MGVISQEGIQKPCCKA